MSFNVFYVCIVLGLSVIWKPIRFDDCTVGLVNDLFDDEDITIRRIVLKLGESRMNEEDNVHHYCRLYIMLVFAVFYISRTSRTICSLPSSLLDSSDMLNLWNCGGSLAFFICEEFRSSFLFVPPSEEHCRPTLGWLRCCATGLC